MDHEYVQDASARSAWSETWRRFGRHHQRDLIRPALRLPAAHVAWVFGVEATTASDTLHFFIGGFGMHDEGVDGRGPTARAQLAALLLSQAGRRDACLSQRALSEDAAGSFSPGGEGDGKGLVKRAVASRSAHVSWTGTTRHW